MTEDCVELMRIFDKRMGEVVDELRKIRANMEPICSAFHDAAAHEQTCPASHHLIFPIDSDIEVKPVVVEIVDTPERTP